MENELGEKKIKYEQGKHPNSQQALRDNEKATQYGQPNAPIHSSAEGVNKPWSIRGMLKYYAHVGLTWEDIRDLSENELIGLMLPDKKKCTMVQVGSARQHIRYAKECIEAANMADSIDGKLVNTNLNSDFNALSNMSIEELREYRNQLSARREQIESAGNNETGNADRAGGTAAADSSAAAGG